MTRPYDHRPILTPAQKVHVAREEFYKPGDSLWAPGGPRGTALTRGLKRRIQQQYDDVYHNPGLNRAIRAAIKGRSKREAENIVESMITLQAAAGALMYGTVRRVAEWRLG